MSDESKHIIHVGLDYPDVLLFWELPEWIIGGSCFMVFLFINETMIGLFGWMLIMWILLKVKDHNLRGTKEHLLWKAGLIQGRGFDGFPPASAVRFDQ